MGTAAGLVTMVRGINARLTSPIALVRIAIATRKESALTPLCVQQDSIWTLPATCQLPMPPPLLASPVLLGDTALQRDCAPPHVLASVAKVSSVPLVNSLLNFFLLFLVILYQQLDRFSLGSTLPDPFECGHAGVFCPPGR